MATIPVTSTVMQDIVESAEERELWIVAREHERPPFFHEGKGGDTRLARAIRVCFDGKITPNSDGSYTVEGSAGRTYRVTNSCSCPHSQSSKSKYCYHFVAVCLYIEWQRRLRPMAPVALGTLRTGTLPLPPATVDERLAQAPDLAERQYPTLDDRQRNYTQASLPPTAADKDPQYMMPTTPQEDRMADNEYIPEPDDTNTPVAILEPPASTHAPRPLPGPVLLPALDAQSLQRSMQEWSAQRQVIRSFLQQELKEGIDFYRCRSVAKMPTPRSRRPERKSFSASFSSRRPLA